MSRQRVRNLIAALLTLTILLVVMAAACTDDGDEPATVPAATPTADGEEASPTAAANSVIGAVAVYVTGTGLDGETFEVTDPINCLAFAELADEEKPFGQICINFQDSQFSDTTGVMEVWAYGTEDTWQLTLELQNLSWVVTGAEAGTSEGDEQ